jgi:hypothetical protein
LAFTAIDFTGKGIIKKEDFLDSLVVQKRIKFTNEELQMFFKAYNIFCNGRNDEGIIFDKFKKIFFPQMYIIKADRDDVDEIKAHKIRELLGVKHMN